MYFKSPLVTITGISESSLAVLFMSQLISACVWTHWGAFWSSVYDFFIFSNGRWVIFI